MKVGILGNMNNMYFSLARYLADEGYDCELLVFDYEPNHFHPTADTFLEEVNFNIRQLNWGDYGRFFKDPRKIEKDLAPYEFLIGNGTAPAFVNLIGRTLDLFIPYGSDLYELPFLKPVHPLKLASYLRFSIHQRRGIRRCPVILFDYTNVKFENVFKRLRYAGKRIASPPPLFYYKEYDQDLEKYQTVNPFYQSLKQLRAQNELLVLQHVRQFWKFHLDGWSCKGNDRLIKGYALFRKNNPAITSKLLLFEYGPDVAETKKLIAALGLSEHVLWFPKTLRKHLMLFIRICDVVVGELYHSWNTYCVVMETLAMEKPFMHKRLDEDLVAAYPELYPMIHAAGPQSVCEGLEEVVRNREKMEETARGGKEWFLHYCVDTPLAHIKSLIAAKEKKVHA